MEMASGLLSRNNLGCFAFYFFENRISFNAVFFLQKKFVGLFNKAINNRNFFSRKKIKTPLFYLEKIILKSTGKQRNKCDFDLLLQ